MESQQEPQFGRNSERLRGAGDAYPQAYPNGPERLVKSPNERERSVEMVSSTEMARSAVLPALQTPVSSIAMPQPSIPISDGSAIGAPVLAADDDLIEKEWVDKAKQIITETKDNPYQREQRIGELQREYIYKRYGRKIGDAGE